MRLPSPWMELLYGRARGIRVSSGARRPPREIASATVCSVLFLNSDLGPAPTSPTRPSRSTAGGRTRLKLRSTLFIRRCRVVQRASGKGQGQVGMPGAEAGRAPGRARRGPRAARPHVAARGAGAAAPARPRAVTRTSEGRSFFRVWSHFFRLDMPIIYATHGLW